jgi:ribonucleoside-diphosphate reductase alpha chain
MRVTKRNGGQESAIVDVNKIVRAVTRSAEGLHGVDPLRVALKTIGGLYDGATTQELDQLSIRTAAALTAEEPEYGQLAARLLGAYIDKEVSGQEIQSFSQSIARGAELGILNARLRDFVALNARKLNDAIDPLATRRFEYFGLRTVYDRYLLRHPQKRFVIETPQHFFMRIACALGGNEIGETLELYRLLSSLEYIASSPTLFNAGTRHEQLSSCYLLDSPPIRWSRSTTSTPTSPSSASSPAASAGYSRVRSRGSLIKGTNGHSNGLVPWLKTLDSSVAAVNQGGKRKGAACVYLESWHPDIEEFLELRDNTGDDARRTHNLNLANWIPGRIHAPGRGRRRLVAVRSQGPGAASADLWGEDVRRSVPPPRPTVLP